DLAANDVSLNASETEGRSLVVRGQKGSLSYAVESGSEHLIQVNTDGRVFAIGKSGTAQVRVHDSGDDYYQARDLLVNIHLYQVGAEQLQFAPLTGEFREGLTLTPVRLDSTETKSIRYEIINSTPDDKVADVLNPDTGLLLIQ
ncbi:cadherin repeat domain-containing protein, partial [Vibrio owensii]